MKDYWNELSFKERISKQERFNFILNYLDEQLADGEPEGKTNDMADEDDLDVTSDISVHVTDSDEQPIQDATVSLDGTDFHCTTGTRGGCTIRNVPLGDYDVTTTKEGYIDDVDDITVIDGDNSLEITLEHDTVDADAGEDVVEGSGPSLDGD